jgi:hypothetical protein
VGNGEGVYFIGIIEIEDLGQGGIDEAGCTQGRKTIRAPDQRWARFIIIVEAVEDPTDFRPGTGQGGTDRIKDHEPGIFHRFFRKVIEPGALKVLYHLFG